MSISKKLRTGLGLSGLALLCLVAGCQQSGEKSPIITVTGGQVQGIVVSESDYPGQDLHVYKGIPFAASTAGDNRWRAPKAVDGWEGVRETSDYGPVCPQTTELLAVASVLIDGQGMASWRSGLLKSLMGFAPVKEQSEDCLSLNVWTQADASASSAQQKPKAVMVWIHGGGHQAGSAADGMYEGHVVARKDVVLVTINYRLAVLGYLAHPEFSAESAAENGAASSGNYGTLDQIAALKWVQDNIAQFGGDPENVTIFGESAGAHSVGQLMASPLAKGLFHRAIAQSGLGAHNYLHLDQPAPGLAASEAAGLRLAEAAGFASGEPQAAALRGLSVEKLLELQSADVSMVANLHPNVDGWVFNKTVASTFQSGEQAPVPLLIGSNADEGSLFEPFAFGPLFWSTEAPTTVVALKALLESEFGKANADALLRYYKVENDSDVHMANLAMWGDSYFGFHGVWGAEQMKKVGQPAYLYFFTRTPPSPTQTIGATHSSEIPFVFGGGFPLFEVNDFDDALTETMSNYWTAFAKTGLPLSEGDPAWPEYNASAKQMILDGDVRVGAVERTAIYSIFRKRIEQLHAGFDSVSTSMSEPKP